ncbi:hypothetical protein CR513_07495, partial [Mucuna pruriens]
METQGLKGPMIRGRLRRLQEEVQEEIDFLVGQEELKFNLTLYLYFEGTKANYLKGALDLGTSVAQKQAIKEISIDAYMGDHTQGHQGGLDEEANPTLEEPTSRERLKRIQEEVQLKLATLRGQKEAQEGLVLYHLSTSMRAILLRGFRRFLGSEKLGERCERQAKSEETFPQSLAKGHITLQCPNRKAMILRDNRKVESESSHREKSSSSEVVASNDESHYEGDLVMVRRYDGFVEEFKDVFPKDVPHGLPPLRGLSQVHISQESRPSRGRLRLSQARPYNPVTHGRHNPIRVAQMAPSMSAIQLKGHFSPRCHATLGETCDTSYTRVE